MLSFPELVLLREKELLILRIEVLKTQVLMQIVMEKTMLIFMYYI